MPDSLDTCGQKPSLQRKSCGFKNIRIRCGCLSSEGFNNPFFSLFFVAFQRPSVNEPELNNQLNNNLRLRAFMIVYILG